MLFHNCTHKNSSVNAHFEAKRMVTFHIDQEVPHLVHAWSILALQAEIIISLPRLPVDHIYLDQWCA